MAEDIWQDAESRPSGSCPADPSVLSGEVCVKCGFRCIQGCV